MPLTTHFRFLKETVKHVSGATYLAIASLFIVWFFLPSAVSAQIPYYEIESNCYELGTSTITIATDFHSRCLADKGITNVGFFTLHSYPDGTFIADRSTLTDGITYNLKCNAPSTCTTGFGTSPTVGAQRQFRFANSYLGSPTANITLEWTADGPASIYYEAPALENTFYSGNFNTVFTDLTSIAFASSTNTVTFDVTYYIDETELDSNNAARNITMLLVDYESGTTSQDFAQTGEYITPTNGLSTTTLSVTSVVFSNDGTYTFKVSFGNAGTPFSGIYPFEETYIYFDVEIESGSIVSTHVDTPYSPTYGEPQSLPCSLTQLQGCLINTANFLFYPSTASIDAFMTEYDQLENKLPFVYAYQASDLLTDMYTGTASSVPAITVTTGIGDITLISESQLAAIPYVSLIRSLIAAGLWLMLFTVLYRKTLSIHDKQTV